LRAAGGGPRNPPSDHKDKIVDFCHLALLQIRCKNVAANLGKAETACRDRAGNDPDILWRIGRVVPLRSLNEK
jgi:hypothetical protein